MTFKFWPTPCFHLWVESDTMNAVLGWESHGWDGLVRPFGSAFTAPFKPMYMGIKYEDRIYDA